MFYASFPTNNTVLECTWLQLVNIHTCTCWGFEHIQKSNTITNKLTGIILSLCQIAIIDLTMN